VRLIDALRRQARELARPGHGQPTAVPDRRARRPHRPAALAGAAGALALAWGPLAFGVVRPDAWQWLTACAVTGIVSGLLMRAQGSHRKRP
jgi:hypothetical protein